MELLLLATICGAFALLMVCGMNDETRALAELRARAELQFRSTKVVDRLQGIDFNGASATVLQTSETKYLATLLKSNYILTVIASMPDGRKYVFKSAANGRPWVMAQPRGNGHAVQASAPF